MEDTRLVGEWSRDNHWYKMAEQLLKISQEVTWKKFPVEGNVMEQMIMI